MKVKVLQDRRILSRLTIKKDREYEVKLKMSDGYIVKIRNRFIFVRPDECIEVSEKLTPQKLIASILFKKWTG